MVPTIQPSRLRALLTLALVPSLLASLGCSSWKRSGRMPEALVTEERRSSMRVTLADGSVYLVRNPAIRSDSLVGTLRYTVKHDFGWDETRERKDGAIALSDIRKVEVREFDPVKTATFLVVATAVTVAAVAIANDDDGPKRTQPPPPSGGSGDWCLFCSCPLIYSVTGSGERVLDSGTFGGAFLRSLAYTDLDLLEALAEHDGALRLRLQAGDKETDHVDELSLLVVDHPPGVSIATDPDGRIHSYGPTLEPARAIDSRGRDALPSIRVADGREWESALAVRDTASAADLQETLTLEFPRPDGVAAARLILRAHKSPWAGHLMRSFVAAHGTATAAWYAAMDAEPSRTAAFRRTIASEVHMNVSVWDGSRWVRQGSVWGGGAEIAKTHAVPLDLSRGHGKTVRVRLDSAPSFWLVDWAGLDVRPEAPFTVREAALRTATGTEGRDAAPSLRAKDGSHWTIRTGEGVDLVFDAPSAAPKTSRTYLSRATGWYRYHAPETGPPDMRLLDYLAREPQAIRKMSIVRVNEALQSLVSMSGAGGRGD